MSPMLFNVYINDLPKAAPHSTSLFADDSTLTIECFNKDLYESDVQNTIESIISWLKKNNLKINISETKLMEFSQRETHPNLNIKYQNNNISRVEITQSLGIKIDQRLDWKAHIKNLSKRVSKSAYVLFKLSPVFNMEALLTAYYGIVDSVLRFGVIFWGNSTNRDLIYKLQKRCIRVLFKLQ